MTILSLFLGDACWCLTIPILIFYPWVLRRCENLIESCFNLELVNIGLSEKENYYYYFAKDVMWIIAKTVGIRYYIKIFELAIKQ